MTQYHSVQLHSSRALVTKQQPTFDPQVTTATIATPAPNRMLNNGHNNKNNNNEENNNKVYNVYKKLLVGPSIINASVSTKNKISLPSINELDNTIITQQQKHHNCRHWYSPPPPPQQQQQVPVTQYRTVVSKCPQFASSVVVQHDGRTTTTVNTTKRPIKRQRTITPPESTTTDIAIIPNNSRKSNQQQVQRCHSCKSTETPEWRKGPLGPQTLCNACGLIWSKLCKQQEEGGRSRRKYKNSISSSPVTMDDYIYGNSPSPSTSSTLQGSEKNTSNEKLALSFLLS